MSVRRTRLYTDKRNGKFLGVCAGIADYFGWDVTLVRVGFVIATIAGVGFMPLVYLAINWIADPKPGMLYNDSAEDREFWRKVRVAPHHSVRDVHAAFRDADRRLRGVEAYVTSSNQRLANEIESLR